MSELKPFNQRMQELAAEMESLTYHYKDMDKVVRLVELIPELFAKLAHGEQGHRDWLEAAIEAHFDEKPMPDYVAK